MTLGPTPGERAPHEALTWRRRLLIAIFFGLIGAVFGVFYAEIFYANAIQGHWQGARNGFTIGFLVVLFEIEVRGSRRSFVRRLPFIAGLIVRILIVTLIIRASLVANDFLSQWLAGGALVLENNFHEELRDTLVSLGVTIFLVAQMQMFQLIGFRRFNSLLMGRYFRPSEEDRIFLFVDLVGSTRCARKLGNIRFHEYLSEFFHTLDRAIVVYRGEIVSYVGDAVIVTWPLTKNRKRNAACIRALQMMGRDVERRMDRFERAYDVRPQFRAGMHGGHVVVGECGDSRRQITFLGDVVNMTARIEEACKTMGKQFLISDYLLQNLDLPDGVNVAPLGEFTPHGTDEPFQLHELTFADATAVEPEGEGQ